MQTKKKKKITYFQFNSFMNVHFLFFAQKSAKYRSSPKLCSKVKTAAREKPSYYPQFFQIC